MAKNEVMLLPALHGLFQDYIINGATDFAHLNISAEKIPSTRWLISKLHSYFGDSIKFECKHRYVGILVFHTSCDLLKALSAVFGQLKQASEKQNEELPADSSDSSASLGKSITMVSYRRLHEQTKKFISDF